MRGSDEGWNDTQSRALGKLWQLMRTPCGDAAGGGPGPVRGAGRGASAEFGFADGLEVRDAGGVRDGAVEADAPPAAVELEGGEHVVEPGAAGDPPPEPGLGRPGQPGHLDAGHPAGPGRSQLMPAPEALRQRVVDRRADRLVDGSAGIRPRREVHRGQVAVVDVTAEDGDRGGRAALLPRRQPGQEPLELAERRAEGGPVFQVKLAAYPLADAGGALAPGAAA